LPLGPEWYGTPAKAARRTSHTADSRPPRGPATDLIGDLNERERRLRERQRVVRSMERQQGRRTKALEAMRKEAEERFEFARRLHEDALQLKAEAAEAERKLLKMRIRHDEKEARLNAQQVSNGRRAQELSKLEEDLKNREADVTKRLSDAEDMRAELRSQLLAVAEKEKEVSNSDRAAERELRIREAAVAEKEKHVEEMRASIRRDRDTMEREWRHMVKVVEEARNTNVHNCGAQGFPVLGLVADLAALTPGTQSAAVNSPPAVGSPLTLDQSQPVGVARPHPLTPDLESEPDDPCDAVETLRSVGCYGLSILVHAAVGQGSCSRVKKALVDAGLHSLADCFTTAAALTALADEPVDALHALFTCTSEGDVGVDSLRLLQSCANFDGTGINSLDVSKTESSLDVSRTTSKRGVTFVQPESPPTQAPSLASLAALPL